MADLCDDRLFRCLEGSFKFGCPFESAPCAEKWLEWCHNVAQLCIARNLINKAKPAANVRGRCWRRKVADGVHVFWQGLDGFVGYAEPCEVNHSPREMEFLCIEDDSCLAYTDEKVNGSPPVRLQVGVILHVVIHTTLLSLKVI